jgi:uncharacterized iron-regulated protein
MRSVSKRLKILGTAVAAVFFLVGNIAAHPHPIALDTDLMPYPFWTAPQSDDIYHVPTGTRLSFDGMMDVLSGGRVIYVGETHNNIHSHRMQLEIIRDLSRRYPGRIAVGMEMFREPQQESLDLWTAGKLSEPAFLKESKWFENWSSDFGYYREIMDFARDSGIDVVALNPPIELQRAYGMSPAEDMDPLLTADLPSIDSSDPYHRAMVAAYYGSHQGGEGMEAAFLRVQLLWEEHMAERITEYLGSPRGEGKIMVVLAGGTHVQYGFGIPKKVLRRMPLPYYVVLPANISSPEEEPEGEHLYVDVEIPEIPLLSGDFIWAVPYDLLEESRVLMGIRMKSHEDGVVIDEVLENSPASAAGLLPGDRLVALDDLTIEGMADVRLVLGSKQVGDSVSVVVLRGTEELRLSASFREPAG